MSVEIYSGGTLVSAGQTINNAKIANPSSMYVYDGGIANSAIVTTYGSMYIEDGGIAYDIVVQSGGTANVASGGKIKNTVVSASADSNGMIMGSAVVNVSGIAENTVLQGVLVSNMGGMSGTAVMNIGSGGKAVDTTVNSRGAFYVSGSAENTTVNSGGYFYVSGNIKNTTVNSGGRIYLGGWTISGTNIVVEDLYLKKGGLLNGKFSLGEDRYFDSIEFVESENGTGWFLNDNLLLIIAGGTTSNFGLHVLSGTVDNIMVTGGNNTMYGPTPMSTEGFIISAGAVANNTVNAAGTMHVYGTANDTVVYGRAVSGGVVGTLSTYYGVVNVYDGGIINDTLVEEYGKVVVSSGGTVNNISVMSGGDVSFSDGAILRGVNNIAGSINNNTMGMGMLNAVDAEGAVINFALNELSAAHASTNDTAGTTGTGTYAIICDSLNKFTGAEFTITVNANQAKGYYNLSSFTGGDSSSFLYDGEMTITVGDYSEALSVGDSLIYNGIEYTLQYAGSPATKLQLMVNYEGSEGFYMPTSNINTSYNNVSVSNLSNCTILNHTMSFWVGSGSNLYLEGSANIYNARDIKVYNGGTLNLTKGIGYNNLTMISAGGAGNGSNIDVYSGGEVNVCYSSTSATDVVIHSGGSMTVWDDEAIASNVKIEHGGKMFIQDDGEVADAEIAGYAKVKEDGTLRDSIVEKGGLTYVMDDGYAENITVNADGNFYVAMGGYAENITINGGNVHIATGGMISDVNIDSGNLFLYGGAVIDGTINLNGTVVLDDIAYNNGVINIMISKESVSTPMINDMSRLDGGELNVSVENAGVGEYIIAGNAGNFNSSISVTGVNGENVGDLNVGDSVTVNSVDYSLVKELDRLIVKAVVEKDLVDPTIESVVLVQNPESYNFIAGVTASDDKTPAEELVFNIRYSENANDLANSDSVFGLSFTLSPEDAGKTIYYQVSATDKFGNTTWSAVQSAVVNDVTAPVIAGEVDVAYDDRQVTVSWADIASDNLEVKGYYLTVNDKKYTVDSNSFTFELPYGEYSAILQAFDEAGNVSNNIEFTLDVEDNIFPTLTISGVPEKYTNEKVTLTASTDDETAVIYYCFSDDYGNWIEGASVVIEENKTVYFRVVDPAGNGVTESVTVDKIDMEKPVISIEGDTETPTYSFAVSINVSEDAELYVKFEDNEWSVFDKNTLFWIGDNGTYYFKAIDIAGNEGETSIIINNILGPEYTELEGGAIQLRWTMNTDSPAIVYLEGSDIYKQISFISDTAGVDLFGLPADSYSWNLKAVCGSGRYFEGNDFTASALPEDSQYFLSEENGIKDVFFARTSGVWSDRYFAEYHGDNNCDFLQRDAELVGKNRIIDVFEGSDDANILILTDSLNGDALFVEDLYSAAPTVENQIRLNRIDEIYAGDGDDLIDMTSHIYHTDNNMIIHGGIGHDIIWSANTQDVLFGDEGNDILVGAGETVFVGGEGSDEMYADGGRNIFTFCEFFGEDRVYLDQGDNIFWFEKGDISYWNAEEQVYFDEETGCRIEVFVDGYAPADIEFRFGNDGSELYGKLASMDAFEKASSDYAFTGEVFIA